MTKNTKVNAAILIIGNEILSGRTQDTNTSTLANWLNSIGVKVNEVRVIPDAEKKIIDNKLFGINTDYEAFKITLKEWLDNSFNSKALILGTGGSSKSVSLALKIL